jgi:hypothetical protein
VGPRTLLEGAGRRLYGAAGPEGEGGEKENETMDGTEYQWYDAVDHRPQLVCLVETADGEVVEALYTVGDWETLDGKFLKVVRFSPLRPIILTPLWKTP